MRIRIKKHAAVEGGAPPAPIDHHIPGQSSAEGYSIPIDYCVEGELLREIKKGVPVLVNRDTRNGIKAPGLFHTSVVTFVSKTQFKTLNSVYDYELLT